MCGVRKAQKGECFRNDGVINCFVCWLLTGVVDEKQKSIWLVKMEITGDFPFFFLNFDGGHV